MYMHELLGLQLQTFMSTFTTQPSSFLGFSFFVVGLKWIPTDSCEKDVKKLSRLCQVILWYMAHNTVKPEILYYEYRSNYSIFMFIWSWVHKTTLSYPGQANLLLIKFSTVLANAFMKISTHLRWDNSRSGGGGGGESSCHGR